jgi:photosystem II stability/assembly factor-like uncharacterized protein
MKVMVEMILASESGLKKDSTQAAAAGRKPRAKKTIWRDGIATVVAVAIISLALGGCGKDMNPSGQSALPGSMPRPEQTPTAQVQAPQRLTALFFLDSDTGWVSGYSGATATDPDDDVLLATEDAGKTWTRLTPPGGSVLQLRFVDGKRGWAVSEIDTGTGGYGHGYQEVGVFGTVDGGNSWTQQWQGPWPKILSNAMTNMRVRISFFGASNGFVLVGGILLRTKDGGTTWAAISLPDGFTPDDASFVGDRRAWVAGRIGGQSGTTEATGPVMYSTSDGGETWRQVFSARDYHLPHSDSYWGGSAGVSFTDATNGWLYFKDSAMEGYLYRTTDGGVTWKQQQQDLVPGRTVAGAPDFIDDTGWLPVASGAAPLPGGLFITRDGGDQWTAVGSGNSGSGDADNGRMRWSIGAISLVSPSVGWAIGVQTSTRGFLIGTTDGGGTWRQVMPALSPTGGISFVPNGEGLGIGLPSDPKAVLSTTDGGRTWTEVSRMDTWPVAVFDDGKGGGWVVTSDEFGSGWDVMRSSDGGRTWTALSRISLDTPTGIPMNLAPSAPYFRFFDDKNGVLQTGDYPLTVLLATSNGGKTWQQRCAMQKPPASWTKFSFVTPSSGYMLLQSLGTKDAAGQPVSQPSVSLMQTSDGGQAWATVKEFETDFWVQGLSFTSGEQGRLLVCHDPLSQQPDMQILKTDDGGKTWQAQPLSGPTAQILLDSAPEFTQMSFTDDNNGWILSPHGVLYTHDGGQTWSEMP